MLHGEAAPKLFETWLLQYTEKVLYLAKQDDKLPSFNVQDMTLGKLKLTFFVLWQMVWDSSNADICSFTYFYNKVIPILY